MIRFFNRKQPKRPGFSALLFLTVIWACLGFINPQPTLAAAARTPKGCHICDPILPDETSTPTPDACGIDCLTVTPSVSPQPPIEQTATPDACGIECLEDTPSASPQPPAQQTAPPFNNPAAISLVFYWMEGCPHCDEVLATTLPALEQKYGSLLNIQKIELISVEDVDQLYQLGEAFGLKRENIKVPFVVMGDKALVGKADINKNLPLLMQSALEENQASLNAADSPAPAFSASPLNFMIPVIAAGLTLVGLIVNRVRKKRETNNLEE